MRTLMIGALFASALSVAACETYYDDEGGPYGRYDYVGSHYDRIGNDCGAFAGRGGEWLDPWLACTDEGRTILRYRFDSDDDARIGRDTADRANVWFRRHADTNRDMRLTDPEIRAALVNGARWEERR